MIPSYREKQTIRTKLNVRMLENIAAAQHQDFGFDEMCWKERDDYEMVMVLPVMENVENSNISPCDFTAPPQK